MCLPSDKRCAISDLSRDFVIRSKICVPRKETKWTTTTRSTLTHNRQKNVLIAWFARLSILYSVTSVWTTEKVHKGIAWFYLKRNKSTNIESTFHHLCDSKLFKWAIFDRKNPTLEKKVLRHSTVIYKKSETFRLYLW